MRAAVLVAVATVAALALAVQPAAAAFPFSGMCSPTNASCWPTANDVAALSSQLSNGTRLLRWFGPGTARPCSVPAGAIEQQPLYGAGWFPMPPVSALDPAVLANASELCFEDPLNPSCLYTMRNNPLNGWKPGFTVWALAPSDVQAAIGFAVKHQLCISVLGTGHDFINRHSCPSGGVLIRTTLLKEQTFLPEKDAFRFGAGVTFSEGHKAAAEHDRVIASGWANTVGILGWSIGGGHGPFAPAHGLGVDNILEVEIVTSPHGFGEGAVVIANATHNVDLFTAVRGGGGSVWGVITTITVRAHPIPDGGFTLVKVAWVGGFCNDNSSSVPGLPGRAELARLAQHSNDWMLSLGTSYGGLVWWMTEKTNTPGFCGANWTAYYQYVYLGPKDSPELQETFSRLANPPADSGIIPAQLQPEYANYSTWWRFIDAAALEPIYPWPWLASKPDVPKGAIGGLPSVLVDRAVFNATLSPSADHPGASRAVDALLVLMARCAEPGGECHRQEMYHDITGNVGSPQPTEHNSLSPGMRTAMVHWLGGSGMAYELVDTLYAMGNNSYFAESAVMFREPQGAAPGKRFPAFAERLWGADAYERLLGTKQRWAPGRTFWCHQCVGDTPANE